MNLEQLVQGETVSSPVTHENTPYPFFVRVTHCPRRGYLATMYYNNRICIMYGQVMQVRITPEQANNFIIRHGGRAS